MHQQNLLHCPTWSFLLFLFAQWNGLKSRWKNLCLKKWTTSICIALLERQVYKVPPYFLTSFQPSFTTDGPKISTPQYVNSGSIHILSFGKSAIFCCWSCPLIDTFPNHWLHQLIAAYDPKTRRSYLVDGVYLDQHVRPCYDTIILSSQQFYRTSAVKLDDELYLICHIFQFFTQLSIYHLGPRMDLILLF